MPSRSMMSTGFTNVSSGLLVLRMVTGLVFFMHGSQKVFDNGLEVTRDGFDAMGVPLPAITSVIVTFLELIGGLALMAGLLTRIVSALLVIDMLAAMFIVHIDHRFFVTNGGIELVLILAAASLTLAITGPGAYSVDAALLGGGTVEEPLDIDPVVR